MSAALAAFALLGRVLEELADANVSVEALGGQLLAQRFLSRTFDLSSTQISLDNFGQRLMHEQVFDMDPSNWTFKVSTCKYQYTAQYESYYLSYMRHQ